MTPPELMTSISPHDRDSAIALVNFQPQALSKDRVRFDLRVAFQCIPVRKERLLSYADFYIGCTSASVQLDVDGQTICVYTPGMKLDVNFKDTQRQARASKVAVEPSMEFKSAALEGKLSAGSFSPESTSESILERSFATSESYLAAVNRDSSVIWRLDPPSRKRQVVRDFLFCNLDLHAVCTDDVGSIRGQIKVRPSDLQFYGPDCRPYEKLYSLMLFYSLFKAKRSIFRPRGIQMKFSEKAP